MNAFMNTTTNTSANTSTQTCNSLSGCHKLPHCVEFMTAGTQKRKALTDKRRQADEALPPQCAACNISLQHLLALPRHIHEVQKQQQQQQQTKQTCCCCHAVLRATRCCHTQLLVLLLSLSLSRCGHVQLAAVRRISWQRLFCRRVDASSSNNSSRRRRAT